MPRILASRSCAALLVLCAASVAVAQESPPAEQRPSEVPASQEPPAQSAAPPRASKFEGAVGLILAYEPAFSGSSDFKIRPHLAGFVRYGRITISGAGGFTTKRADDVERGLDAELIRRSNVRVNLALRFDGGRSETDSADLTGMGDVRATVRARLGVRWEPAPLWSLSASSGSDVLARNGGSTFELGVSRTFPLDAGQRIILGASASAANARYLQTWYGVTPAQSAASGYAVYQPQSGLRDARLGATWRVEINPQWAGFAGAGASHLLGPAADSPLVKQRNGWGVTGGIVRRF